MEVLECDTCRTKITGHHLLVELRIGTHDVSTARDIYPKHFHIGCLGEWADYMSKQAS